MVAPKTRRLTNAEYHELIDSGVLSENARVELIEGVIAPVSPRSPEHAYAVAYLLRLLNRALDDTWIVFPGGPLTLEGVSSEPEPDVVVVRAEVARTAARHPTTASLVVEVARTSLSRDRSRARLYAGANVAEYWIVDLVGRSVEVHRLGQQPIIVTPPAELRPLEFPDVVVPVGSLFREQR